MKVVRITHSWFETNSFGNREEKFSAGAILPLNEATQRQVDLLNAEVIEAPDDYEKAEAAALKAEERAATASAAADHARDAADAAAAVEQAKVEAAT